ncbi:hypothetical protein HU200_025627 [Digitaria exilis]|uniref:Pentatricopeptide repeat-containing protein n=1 Tax=Digitaria exilis TaxID=1010633 RepID=A0A835ESK8_9POAL|nr:hypothetical protein HU200_025627 [Digitaria exilis]
MRLLFCHTHYFGISTMGLIFSTFYLLPSPSTASYTNNVAVLSRHGRPHEALPLFSASAVAPTPSSSLASSRAAAARTALVALYARSGKVSAARRVFSYMDGEDVVSWNAMIGGFASAGSGRDREAWNCFREMRVRGVRGNARTAVAVLGACDLDSGRQPDSMTFTAVLMACCHCGLIDEGLELFKRFVSVVGLIPTMEQCACIVDLLARAGRFLEALEFIGRMPMRPNAVVWGALLSASRMHHDVEFARIAFEQLVQVEPENAGNFVTMSNIYAKAGMVEDAKRVRMMIDRVELAKPSGQSCVEVESFFRVPYTTIW